jgi:dUTPase
LQSRKVDERQKSDCEPPTANSQTRKQALSDNSPIDILHDLTDSQFDEEAHKQRELDFAEYKAELKARVKLLSETNKISTHQECIFEQTLREYEEEKERAKQTRIIRKYSMKFSRPRDLTLNSYPDYDKPQPQLIKELIHDIVYPKEGSRMQKYYQATVDFLKQQKRNRTAKESKKITRAYFSELGKKLYFVKCRTWIRHPAMSGEFRALIDTGASNSLIHTSVASRLGIEYQPAKMTLATATGLDSESVKGIAHLKFALLSKSGSAIHCCANFIVSSKLNGLQSIVGAEFLFDDDRVKSIGRTALTMTDGQTDYEVDIYPDTAKGNQQMDQETSPNDNKEVNLLCQACGNKNGRTLPAYPYKKTITVSHAIWTEKRPELDEYAISVQPMRSSEDESNVDIISDEEDSFFDALDAPDAQLTDFQTDILSSYAPDAQLTDFQTNILPSYAPDAQKTFQTETFPYAPDEQYAPDALIKSSPDDALLPTNAPDALLQTRETSALLTVPTDNALLTTPTTRSAKILAELGARLKQAKQGNASSKPPLDSAESKQQTYYDYPEDKKQELRIHTHSFRQQYENETMPPSEELFDDTMELKFEVLDKKTGLDEGDFTHCPPEWLPKIKALLKDFSDRFSTSKLDLEVTDLYEADLETMPGRKVIQKVRPLPNHKFNFALKAIRQLEAAGVVQESDSAWRSNVVMVPKPTGKNELRTNTKADYQSGEQNAAAHYRICLDFRNLNDILVFPKQVAFPTIDKFLHKLKNKWVVSVDISSAFFIIPIKEEDRYKTAFWVNDLAFEFRVLVMGLKSSPYHLKKFLDTVFSTDFKNKYITRMSQQEQELIAESFSDILVAFFDDIFVIGDTCEQVIAHFKLVLMIAREAKIKFSAEKSSFVTTRVKVLGYDFDTHNVVLTMDQLKASAIRNLKKPSSLYELHSRLASFQYNSMFIPFLKHIAYPLHFMLRKGEFTWGAIEERSWQVLKEVATMGLRLTVPDSKDNLVLTTDASKVAASACLFREKDGKLELVSTSSKYFAVTDLNKCSYMLEMVALTHGLKTYATYLLNCEGTIRILTDAKSLVYAKRNSTHSILLNSTLTYLQNFVSLVNVELYHIPGTVNVLADVMSRAIADNLNCALPREHPISKAWAKELPPLTDKFGVTNTALFEFLTRPLKPEPQDLHDRKQKSLIEPRTVQETFDLTKTYTAEDKYYAAIRLMEQWNDKRIRDRFDGKEAAPLTDSERRIYYAKLQYDMKHNEAHFEKLEDIMDKVYLDIKGTETYRKLLKNLEEASKAYIKAKSSDRNTQDIELFNNKMTEFRATVDSICDIQASQTTEKDIKSAFNKLDLTKQTSHTGRKYAKSTTKCKYVDDRYRDSIELTENTAPQPVIGDPASPCAAQPPDSPPNVGYILDIHAKYKPAPNTQYNTLDLPLQSTTMILPNEIRKIDLGIKFEIPSGYCASIVKKKCVATTNDIQVHQGFIDIGYKDFLQVAVQNMANQPVLLLAGQAICQLALQPAKLTENPPGFNHQNTRQTAPACDKDAPISLTAPYDKKSNALPLTDTSVPFTLTDLTNGLTAMHAIVDETDPSLVHLGTLRINFIGQPVNKINTINDMLELESELMKGSSVNMTDKMPLLQTGILDTPSQADPDNFRDDQGQYPDLSASEMAALLASDLTDNFKLSVETMQDLQNAEKRIQTIKEGLIGNKDEYKYFVMKKGILCREYTLKDDTTQQLGIYVPTSILYAVIIYLHKHFLHPSRTQTLREFQNLYYHPFAKRAVQKVCDSCLVCAQSRNANNPKAGIGRERTLKPTKPREAVSIDVLYFPPSAKNSRYGLIVADLYSLYISFYPMRTKNSSEIAKNLRTYFSAQCPPTTVYSDNDPSFRGDVENLFRMYKVTHMTSYPYTQKQNYVESQVRIFKNAYRAAIIDSPVFQNRDWDVLYPLVVCRINSMISKYGMSREAMHYGHIVESSLPLITDAEVFQPLEDHLDEIAKNFRERMGKFMQRRLRNKVYYRVGKTYNFYINELVMYKVYAPESMLHPTFVGPARIVDLQEAGATLRDTRTGTLFSVSFANLRKIDLNELLSLLPQNFDAEIAETLGHYRYRRKPEIAENAPPAEAPLPVREDWTPDTRPDIGELVNTDPIDPETDSPRRTRSGRIFNVKISKLPEKYAKIVKACTVRMLCVPKLVPGPDAKPGPSCLKRTFRTEKLPSPPDKHVLANKPEISDKRLEKLRRFKDKLRKFGLRSSKQCTLEMVEDCQKRPGRIKFGKTTVYFI